MWNRRYDRYDRFPRYVSVAERRELAEKNIRSLSKKGETLNPIVITGRTIGQTFWGKSWCKHLESLGDYENRLPRGRSYARNGAVIDLVIAKGKIDARVQGSRLYKILIEISPCPKEKWRALVAECSGKIDSLIELLHGKFSKNVMEIITHKDKGLFPDPHEIKLNCSCPDYATMCKHVAAVLYGISARLDEKPEELFILRHVDHLELIKSSSSVRTLTKGKTIKPAIKTDDLSALFDIDIDETPKPTKLTAKKTAKTKTVKKSPKTTKSNKTQVKKIETKTKSKLKTKTKKKTIKKPTKKSIKEKPARKTG